METDVRRFVSIVTVVKNLFPHSQMARSNDEKRVS